MYADPHDTGLKCRGAFQAWEVYNSMWPIRIGFLLQGGSLQPPTSSEGVEPGALLVHHMPNSRREVYNSMWPVRIGFSMQRAHHIPGSEPS